jgi:hypothetical protein
MATEQSSGGIRPSTFYSMLSTVFLSMFLAFLASNRDDDYWYRLFIMVYLVGMQIVFVVMAFTASRAERQSKAKPKAEPPAPADQPRDGQ